jgi:hypothetical protein
MTQDSSQGAVGPAPQLEGRGARSRVGARWRRPARGAGELLERAPVDDELTTPEEAESAREATRLSCIFVWVFVYKPNTQTYTLAARSLPKCGSAVGLEEGGPRFSASLQTGDPLPRPTTTQMCRVGPGAE